eukprot:Skav216758  [mRNA]  locus=scaffold3303:16269:17855:- [translate_table: standard]
MGRQRALGAQLPAIQECCSGFVAPDLCAAAPKSFPSGAVLQEVERFKAWVAQRPMLLRVSMDLELQLLLLWCTAHVSLLCTFTKPGPDVYKFTLGANIVVKGSFIDMDDHCLVRQYRKLRRVMSDSCLAGVLDVPEVYEPGRFSNDFAKATQTQKERG